MNVPLRKNISQKANTTDHLELSEFAELPVNLKNLQQMNVKVWTRCSL